MTTFIPRNLPFFPINPLLILSISLQWALFIPRRQDDYRTNRHRRHRMQIPGSSSSLSKLWDLLVNPRNVATKVPKIDSILMPSTTQMDPTAAPWMSWNPTFCPKIFPGLTRLFSISPLAKREHWSTATTAFRDSIRILRSSGPSNSWTPGLVHRCILRRHEWWLESTACSGSQIHFALFCIWDCPGKPGQPSILLLQMARPIFHHWHSLRLLHSVLIFQDFRSLGVLALKRYY